MKSTTIAITTNVKNPNKNIGDTGKNVSRKDMGTP